MRSLFQTLGEKSIETKRVLIYLLLGFLPLSVNFILAPIFANEFQPSEYALLGLAGVLLNFFSFIIPLGLHAAATRFYFDYRKKELLKKALFSTIFICVISAFACLFMIFHFIGDRLFSIILANSEFTYSKYGIWILINGASSIFNVIALSYFRNEENIGAFTLASLSFFFLSVGGNLVGVFVFDLGAFGSIAGRSIGTAVAVLPYVILFLKRGRFTFRYKWIKPLYKYGLALVPYGLLLLLYESLDKIVVEQLFGLSFLGEYTFAYQISSVASVLIFSVFNAISPKINKELSEKRRFKDISNFTLLFLFASMGMVSFCVVLVKPMILLFIDSSYHGIIPYLPILLVSFIGRAFYLCISIHLLYFHRNASLSWVTLSAVLLGVIFIVVFKSILGFLAAYLGVLIIKLSQGVFAGVAVNKFGDIPLKKLALNKVTLLALLIIGVVLMPFVLVDSWLNQYFYFFPFLFFIVYCVFNINELKELLRSL